MKDLNNKAEVVTSANPWQKGYHYEEPYQEISAYFYLYGVLLLILIILAIIDYIGVPEIYFRGLLAILIFGGITWLYCVIDG